jgi:hypothetical protein
VLASALLLVSQASFPNLSITTRTTTDRPGTAIEIRTVQIKGQRQRHSFGVDIRDRRYQSGPSIEIIQCDLHREIILNESAKIYGIISMPDRAALLRARAAAMSQPADTRPVTQTITIDAEDAGERRKVGRLEARHVITKWTMEAKDAVLKSTRVQDGWYVDLPTADCERHDRAAFLTSERSGERSEVKWRGTAHTGFPIEEIDRTDTSYGIVERRLRLASISEAPLPDSLFDVPPGYRPALPTFGGGFDLQRPDTWANRAALAWEAARVWVRQWLRSP